MPDFTLNTYYRLLKALKEQQFTFQTFADFLKNPAPRTIILRHDVDARKMNSLQTARMEKELGITGTYYFRLDPGSYDDEVIEQIHDLGHEIGYHYEDISRCAASGSRYAAGLRSRKRPHDKVLPDEELIDIAIASFRENLDKLRRVVPIETICMHGSPLSKYDNRMLWEKYDYRDFGIIGEPYFDINFEEVFYLTDTGRRWDGEAVSIRDKATGVGRLASGEEQKVQGSELRAQVEIQPATSNQQPAILPKIHSTFDIITASKTGTLPDKIMLTVHPQRWTNKSLPWMKELIWQNVKNVAKRFITNSLRKIAEKSA
jgi:hypothetical protein